MGETGIHVGNWEVSAAPCTAQMDTSYKQLLSHLKTISKTFCHISLSSDYYILNTVMKIKQGTSTMSNCSYLKAAAL